MTTTAYHVTPRSNLAAILDEGLVPSIGQRSLDADEAQPAIFLFPDQDSCESALSTWLGECFEDVPDGELLVLELDVAGLRLRCEVAYELICHEPIKPCRIRKVLTEACL